MSSLTVITETPNYFSNVCRPLGFGYLCSKGMCWMPGMSEFRFGCPLPVVAEAGEEAAGIFGADLLPKCHPKIWRAMQGNPRWYQVRWWCIVIVIKVKYFSKISSVFPGKINYKLNSKCGHKQFRELREIWFDIFFSLQHTEMTIFYIRAILKCVKCKIPQHRAVVVWIKLSDAKVMLWKTSYI